MLLYLTRPALRKTAPDSIIAWTDHFLWVDLGSVGFHSDCLSPRKVRAAAEVPFDVVRQEACRPGGRYLNLADPDEDAIGRQGVNGLFQKAPKKVKGEGMVKQASLFLLRRFICPRELPDPCYCGEACGTRLLSGDVGPSHPEESESSDDSFYEIPNVAICMWNRVAPPAFFSAHSYNVYDHCYTEFNVGEARQICLGSEVRSRTEHELKMKEKLRAKYAAHVSSLSGEKFALTAKVSVLKVTITQKDHDISLLDSHATSLASGLENAKVACIEAGAKIIS
ncbi:hypothetical protein Tco_0924660 [Tanacetum coccineum]|uniref:Uncharacterized protein n=1 Tax=Tanacetum coccineum TaxID=301880 RepID=A0ABQ5D4H3_9ASTR